MKSYLIDTPNKAVIEVDYSGNYRDIYKLLGEDVDTFTTVTLNGLGDMAFVDDEGLLKESAYNPINFFHLKFLKQPLAGRGLVLGCDDEGESVEPKLSLEELKALVSFKPAHFKGMGPTTTHKGITPFGRATVISTPAIFEDPEDPIEPEEPEDPKL